VTRSAALGRADAERLLAYTEWANRRIRGIAARLELGDWRRDLGSSHGGVQGTLGHMLAAEWVWLERWLGRSPDHLPGFEELDTPAALEERWAALEAERAAWLAPLGDAELLATCRYRNTRGEPFEGPLWQLVQHVANHSTFHRGQVVTLLRQLGARPEPTDLVAWDRGA
jgi:uncharacterized damage-inducible protein DinB